MEHPRVAIAAALAALWLAPAAFAQNPPEPKPPDEAALVERIARDGKDVAAVRELYKVYLQSKRPAEGLKLLETAVGANPGEFELSVMLAAHYAGAGQRERFDETLTRLVAKPEWKDAYLAAGDLCLRTGLPDQALRYYRDGLAAQADRKLLYWKRMVEARMRQGRQADAEAVVNQLLEEFPTDPDGRAMRIAWQLERGQAAEALPALDALAREAPDNAAVHFLRGRVAMAAGRPEAEAELRRAIELRPDHILARVALAQVLLTQAKPDEALQQARAAAAAEPTNLTVRLVEATILTAMQKFPEASAILRALAAQAPNVSAVWRQTGVVHLSQREFAPAEAAFRRAWELNSTDLQSLMGLVETFLAMNRPDDALRLVEGEAEKSKRRELRALAGTVALRTGKMQAAIANFEKALAGVEPSSPAAGELYVNIGEAWRRLGDSTKAIEWTKKARQARPNDAATAVTLGILLENAGRKDEAAVAYEAAVRIDPNHAIALNNLAYLLSQAPAELGRALTYAQSARRLMPHSVEVADTLAWIHLQRKEAALALPLLREIVPRAPANVTFRLHLAMALAATGDKGAARTELRTALKSGPPKEEEQRIRTFLAELGEP